MRNRTTLFFALVILLVNVSCFSRSYIKPGLIIGDKRVGLVVVNYWANIGRQGTSAILNFDERLAKLFKEEIEANTVYRLVSVPSSSIDDIAARYRGEIFPHDLIDQSKLLDKINEISQSAKLDFFILIIVEDFSNIVVQILKIPSGELVFEKFVTKPFRGDVAYNVVSKFPGYFSTKTGRDPAQDFDWIDTVSEGIPGEVEYPEAGAIFLVDESSMKVHIKPGNIFSSFSQYGNIYCTETRHVAIKVLNESGYSYADVEIPFSEDVDVTDIEARTITAKGKEIMLNQEQIHEMSSFPAEYVFFSDLMAKKFAMPGVEPGCIIEYKYKRTIENVAFWACWPVQRTQPILRLTYALDIPRGLRYRIYIDCPENAEEKILEKSTHFEEWEKRGGYQESPLTRESTRLTNEYVLYDLPAIKLEEDMPPLSEIVPQLKFCSATFGDVPFLTSWHDLATWYMEFIKDSFSPSKAIKEDVAKLTKGLESEVEKAEVLYHFVQVRTRYVAKELGKGRVTPQRADDVYQQRYGDCKGFTALLVSMLQEAGIDAYPAILRTRDRGKLDEDYVSLDQFDHMIAYATVDTQVVWLDPTLRTCPYGQLPWQDHGVRALVLKEEPEFSDVVTSSASENLTEREIEVHVLEEGIAQLSGSMSFKGQECMYMRSMLEELNPSQRKDVLNKYIAEAFPDPRSIQCSYSSLEASAEALKLDFSCEIPHYVIQAGDLLILKPGLLSERSRHDYPPAREHPLAFEFPRSSLLEMKIGIPKGYKIRQLPKSCLANTEFGEFRADCLAADDFIVYTKEFSLTSTFISTQKYSDYLKFMDDVAAADQDQIVLVKVFY